MGSRLGCRFPTLISPTKEQACCYICFGMMAPLSITAPTFNAPFLCPIGNAKIFGEQKAPTHQNFGKGLVKPSAIVAVAPTWTGPLPIVFGRGSEMELRYRFLRGTLRAPAVGWMMYNMLVSNEKAIQSQYKSHVYSNPDNVTPNIIESRYALTKRNVQRYFDYHLQRWTSVA